MRSFSRVLLLLGLLLSFSSTGHADEKLKKICQDFLIAHPSNKKSIVSQDVYSQALQYATHQTYLEYKQYLNQLMELQTSQEKTIFVKKTWAQSVAVSRVFFYNLRLRSVFKKQKEQVLKLEKKESEFVSELSPASKPSASEMASDIFRESKRHFSQSIQAITYWFPSIRSDKAVGADFKKNLTLILALQMGTMKLKNIFGGDPVTQNLWMLANTVAMVSLQSEVASANTTKNDKSTSIKDFSSFLQVFSQSLNGKRGYVGESLNKAKGFVALWPLEFLIVWGLKTTNDIGLGIFEKGMTLNQDLIWSSLSSNAGSAAHFLGVFSVYLLTKWSLFDKVFFLNILPAVQNGYREKFESLYLQSIEEKLGLSSQSLLSLEDLVQKEILQSKSEDFDLKVWVANHRHWGESQYATIFRVLGAQRGEFWKLKSLIQKKSKLHRAHKDLRRFHRKEWIARATNIGFDTLVALIIAGS